MYDILTYPRHCAARRGTVELMAGGMSLGGMSLGGMSLGELRGHDLASRESRSRERLSALAGGGSRSRDSAGGNGRRAMSDVRIPMPPPT